MSKFKPRGKISRRLQMSSGNKLEGRRPGSRHKSFKVIRKNGSIYENERVAWPASLGTFRHADQVPHESSDL